MKQVRVLEDGLSLEDRVEPHHIGDVVSLTDEQYARLPQSAFGTAIEDAGNSAASAFPIVLNIDGNGAQSVPSDHPGLANGTCELVFWTTMSDGQFPAGAVASIPAGQSDMTILWLQIDIAKIAGATGVGDTVELGTATAGPVVLTAGADTGFAGLIDPSDPACQWNVSNTGGSFTFVANPSASTLGVQVTAGTYLMRVLVQIVP